jgi:UDP:flavonoid glycosyltransferase YjiC (YdhE family)
MTELSDIITAEVPKRILVCVLDWGLGHASRMIPVIDRIQKEGHKVYIAGNGNALKLLGVEFPELECIDLPFPQVRYPLTKLLLRFPKFCYAVAKEHISVNTIVKEKQISWIISDNRFGAWSRKARSVFVTHQLRLRMSRRLIFIRPFAILVNYLLIRPFDECWIPDTAGEVNLSGKLSHPPFRRLKVRFIKPLSRFIQLNEDSFISSNYIGEVLVVLSGPEPYRTQLENLLAQQVNTSGLTATIIRGIPPGSGKYPAVAGPRYIPIATSAELHRMITSADIVITRSGYSSIMDLVALRKPAILIPTPGQPEQEYLARYMQQKNWFYCTPQKKFNLQLAISEFRKNNCQPPLMEFY